MRLGSLFAGIGGFDLAAENVGMDVAWQVEIEPKCQKLLANKFPDARRYKDVRGISFRSGKAWKRYHHPDSVDLVTGGFPCQDVSIAGGRKGLAGERSGLWFEFARIINELEPGWVVIENVPGLLSSNGGRDFAVIIRWLAERGYGVCWRVFDSQYFGLAQRRRRVFIVGSFGSGCSAKVLFESESGAWGHEPSRGTKKKIARPLANSTTTDHYDESQQTYVVEQNSDSTATDMVSLREVFPNTAIFDGRNMTVNEDVTPTLQAKDQGGYSLNYLPMVFGGNNTSGEIEVATAVNAHPTRRYDFESETFVLPVWHNKQQSGEIRIQDDGTSPSVTKQWGTGGNNVPFVGVRRLTPVECERLQGFPDGWTDGFSDSARYRMLGNAVSVPVVEWILRRINESI